MEDFSLLHPERHDAERRLVEPDASEERELVVQALRGISREERAPQPVGAADHPPFHVTSFMTLRPPLYRKLLARRARITLWAAEHLTHAHLTFSSGASITM